MIVIQILVRMELREYNNGTLVPFLEFCMGYLKACVAATEQHLNPKVGGPGLPGITVAATTATTAVVAANSGV